LYDTAHKVFTAQTFANFSDIPGSLTKGYDRYLSQADEAEIAGDLYVGFVKQDSVKTIERELTGPRYYYFSNLHTGEYSPTDCKWTFGGNTSWERSSFHFQQPFPEIKLKANSLTYSENQSLTIQTDDLFSNYDSALVVIIGSHYRSGPYVAIIKPVNKTYNAVTIEFEELNKHLYYSKTIGISFQASNYFYKWESGRLLFFEFSTKKQMLLEPE
jgi:hypothetical protein